MKCHCEREARSNLSWQSKNQFGFATQLDSCRQLKDCFVAPLLAMTVDINYNPQGGFYHA
jgi:hypothetical protein